jgi:alpha-mannosidase
MKQKDQRTHGETTPLFDLDKDRVLYLVPYTHLDTQWRWDFKKTINVYLKETLEKNFALFEKYHHYVFNFSGAIRYQMVKEYYPEEFKRLKEYIAAGRWQIAGVCVDEADAIVPSAESLIRQILYGGRFFLKEFRKEPVDYILPDCFGFPWSLPSILAHCGIKGFSTQKLRMWSSAAGIPFPIGIWEGPDGESVAAALDPGIYNNIVILPPDRDPRRARRLTKNGENYGVWADYRYYGKGDVGGAPQEISVRTVENSLTQKTGKITVCQSSSDRFFRDLTEEQKNRLPRYCGDLLLTKHSAGCLTSQAMIKRWNRKNELLADAAERAAVMAEGLGIPYPMQALRKAWLRVLGNQMHDILPGTSLPSCYEYSHNDELVALNTFSGVLTDAAGSIATCLDTSGEGISLVVYNPLAFPREDVVEATISMTGVKYVEVKGPEGEHVPCQIIARSETDLRIIFLASLPPCGFVVYKIQAIAAPPELKNGLKIDRLALENDSYRISLNEQGNIVSIVSKANGARELLAEPIQYQFLRENPALFPAWNMTWRDRRKPPIAILAGPAEIEIVEQGPVRVAMRITRRFDRSLFRQHVRLSCGDAGKRIEFSDWIEWRSTGCSLKAAFPLTVSAPEATYNWGLGKIMRGNNDPKKYEVPSHKWFDLTDASGEYGVTVLEDSKYGSDKPADNVLRLTLLFTPRRGRLSIMFKDQGTQDWGRHQFLYGLYGHQGDWREGDSERHALRLNQPPSVFTVPASPGPLGKHWSFLRLNSAQVDLQAMKKAEEEDAYILRFKELWGRPAERVTVTLANGIADAWETDGQERRTGPAQLGEGKLTFSLGAYGIKSFAVVPTEGDVQLEKPLNVPVELPFNIRAFTSDQVPELGELTGGRSYPEELVPVEFACGGVVFRTGAGRRLNALECRGQTISLPAEDFDRLFLLAAAEEDTEAPFRLDDVPFSLHLQAREGLIGMWDRRMWNKPMDKQPNYRWWASVTGLERGFIKRDRIGWYTTHMHGPSGNDAYAYGYMFLYSLPLPSRDPQSARGCKLQLPERRDIFIFAATLTRGVPDVHPSAPLYDQLVRTDANTQANL